MESRLLFLVIIMMIKIIPAVFLKYHCSSIYKILPSSLQWLLWKEISVLAIIYYFLFLHFLSLITLERYDVCAGFPADIFVLEKISHLLHHL